MQAVESTMNIAILVGLGVIALTRLESRWKRGRALASLHTLRSLAHVIDMHQLTKDPSAERLAEPTASSPKRNARAGCSSSAISTIAARCWR